MKMKNIVLTRPTELGGKMYRPIPGEYLEMDEATADWLIGDGTAKAYEGEVVTEDDVKKMVDDQIEGATGPARKAHNPYRETERPNKPWRDAESSKLYKDMHKLSGLENGGFESWGDYVDAVINKDGSRLKTMDGSSGAAGGYMIPSQYSSMLLDAALEAEVVRPRAFVLPMERRDLSVPAFALTDHDNGVMGGVDALWTEESATKTATEPALRSIKLDAHKLVCFAKTSDELKEDGINVAAMIGRAFTRAIAWKLDRAFIRGTGAGEPLGFLTGASLVSQTRAVASEINWDDIVGMWAVLAPGSHARAVWVCSPSCIPQIFTMSQAVGTGGSAMFGSVEVATPPTSLLGRPLLYSEHMSALGTAGDLALCDLSSYIIGMRQDARLEASIHPDFQADLTQFRCVLRCDGQPSWNATETLIDGSEVSPFVQLS